MALTPVDGRQIAAIVTHLEMRDRPKPAPFPPAPLRLVPWKQPDLAAYRALFRLVGEDWMWFSRLVMADEDVLAIIHDPAVQIFAVTDLRGNEVGLLELDFRIAGECELAFFGLIGALGGRGYGKWLMAQAKSLGWRKDVTRLWVHTCTLDSPAALPFYIRSGFTPFAREVEIFDDPRLTGHMPPDCAPQIPKLGQASAG